VRVYVAGSSGQIERAKSAIAALRERGHIVTHDWPVLVERVGSANPPDASSADRTDWATDDLKGVHDADVFWLLMPSTDGFGAAVELGYALAHGRPVVVSGGTPSRSIFTELATWMFDRDDQALDELFTRCDCPRCEADRNPDSQGRN
jgi:nucleoside 2-deoxyribosyltransferase